MTSDKDVVCVSQLSQHSSILTSNLRSMLRDEVLLDCSILCDGQLIRAHKVILCASCDYFKAAFVSLSNSSCQNTAIIINDMSFSDLKAIIDFIYTGEIFVETNRLPSLLKSSQSLQVKHLTSHILSLLDVRNQSISRSKSLSVRPAAIVSDPMIPKKIHSLDSCRTKCETDSPIICQALSGVRPEWDTTANGFDSDNSSKKSNDTLKARSSDGMKIDGYSSSEEIEIPLTTCKRSNTGSKALWSDVDEDNDRAPVDLSSRSFRFSRSHVKPRDFFAKGSLVSGVDQKENASLSKNIVQLQNVNVSRPGSADPATEAEIRSSSFSSGENLKRGRGRPPRHSQDEEIKSLDSHWEKNDSVIPSQLLDEVLTYKRLKLTSLPAASPPARGRRPKLNASGSRETNGKNKCPFCPQVYYSTQAMNDHINNVHSKNALKYGCKYCAKQFSWKISLNKHLRKQHPQPDASKSPEKNSSPTTGLMCPVLLNENQ